MIDFIAPAVLSAVAGLVSGWLGSYLKDRLTTRAKTHDSLRYEIEGRDAIDVPIATDLESLRRRITLMESVSPRLAILDGWQMVSAGIIDRASTSSMPEYKPSQNTLQIARQIPGISAELISKIERLQACRNSVAHSVGGIDSLTLKASIDDVFPILQELAAEHKAASEA
jgi:hypothetical protein